MTAPVQPIAPPTEPTADQLAAIRKGIRVATSQGIPVAKVDEYLKQKFGITSADAMKPTELDKNRAIAQGLTLGHADELYGAYKKVFGGDYTTARDQVRTNDAEANAANPKRMLLDRMLGGAVPAMVASKMLPFLAPVAGAGMMANGARAATMAGGMGAVEGMGNSTATDMGGLAKDAAIGGGVSAVTGGVLGAAGSKIASRGLPKGNAGAVANEAATQLPTDPVALKASLARQNTLAPGTVVLADVSPEMQSLVRGVGADPKTAILARDAAQSRLNTLLDARKAVGQGYDVLKGQMAPVDPDLLSAVVASGRKSILKGAPKEVDLSAVHDLRSQLLAEARVTKNAVVAKGKRDVADQLTAWLTKNEPTVAQLDADYAFLTDRAKAAKATFVAVKNSSKNYATARTYDATPATAGASVPMTLRGVPGTIVQKVGSALGTNRAERAKAVASLLLSPSRTDEGLSQLTSLHDLLLNPPSQDGLKAAHTFVSGLVAPQLGGMAVQATQP